MPPSSSMTLRSTTSRSPTPKTLPAVMDEDIRMAYLHKEVASLTIPDDVTDNRSRSPSGPGPTSTIPVNLKSTRPTSARPWPQSPRPENRRFLHCLHHWCAGRSQGVRREVHHPFHPDHTDQRNHRRQRSNALGQVGKQNSSRPMIMKPCSMPTF